MQAPKAVKAAFSVPEGTTSLGELVDAINAASAHYDGWILVDLGGRTFVEEKAERYEGGRKLAADGVVLRNGVLVPASGSGLALEGPGKAVLDGITIVRDGHLLPVEGTLAEVRSLPLVR